MLIEGYEDDPLVAGEDLLSLPGFWAAYLMWMCESDDEDGEPQPEWFGATGADVAAAYEALTDDERWPVIRVPFAEGHTAVVVGRNFAEDEGIEYFITHPDWGRRGHLATVDGHQAGPGLAWRELIHIAGSPAMSSPGVHDVHARLLLLLPTLGDKDLPAEAADVIGAALRWAGAPAATAGQLTKALLDHPLWDAANWVLPGPEPGGAGEKPFEGILQCDGDLSPRCGIRLAQGITQEQNARLARALGTGGGENAR